MKYILIPLLAVLTGCSTTVPVTNKFPEVPTRLLQVCPSLTIVKDDAKLSELTNTITANYQTYYGCSNTVEGWINWYNTQRSIFDKSSKN